MELTPARARSRGMMTLYRVKLQPTSPWRTPWQADTIAGMLCWTCARASGSNTLRREILDPALGGQPRFILSDAFPGDLLPIPVSVRLARWPASQRKEVKRARFVKRDVFRRIQQGGAPAFHDLLHEFPVGEALHTHNTLDRRSNTTGATGSLFSSSEYFLSDTAAPYLSVYARIEPGFEERFLELLTDLAGVGFGADVSTGMGQFDLASGLEPADDLDAGGRQRNSVIALSTFQPGPEDPVNGLWEAFTKYGKIGPDFGLDNVFKKPLIMLGPGACFPADPPLTMMGRAIPMDELLASADAAALRDAGSEIVHLAYGLTVPAEIDWNHD